MQDQGIVLGTALGLKDLSNGFFVQTVGAQTVDGFRGDGHQTAAFDNFRRGYGRHRVPGGKE